MRIDLQLVGGTYADRFIASRRYIRGSIYTQSRVHTLDRFIPNSKVHTRIDLYIVKGTYADRFIASSRVHMRIDLQLVEEYTWIYSQSDTPIDLQLVEGIYADRFIASRGYLYSRIGLIYNQSRVHMRIDFIYNQR